MNNTIRSSILRLLMLTAVNLIGAGTVRADGAHLFVLSGQSNMNGLDPQDTLLPMLQERFGEDVIVVKDSQGGQSIQRWDKGWDSKREKENSPIGDLYDRLMKKVSAAVGGRKIRTVTFIWMQGEKDARLGNAGVYEASFRRVLEQLRRDLNHENINYVVGRLSDFGNANPKYPDWNKMRAVLVRLADASPRARWVNTDDLNDGKNRRGQDIVNDLHYSVGGYREFGRRLASAAIQTLERNDVPYELAPPADAPYYRVRYEGSPDEGELRFAVQYTVWIPPGVETLRGLIVHQHGCGVGSCRSGFTGAFDLHWQALAEKHDCALFSAVYEQPAEADCGLWCDPRNGSDQTFQRSLTDLGRLAGHPELATVPWALWGHSGGGTWAGTMLFLHPDRVAAAWLRSGCPLIKPSPQRPDRAAIPAPTKRLDAPVMLNLGTEEGFTVAEGRFASVWPRCREVFVALRNQSTPVGVSIDPLTAHQCGNQRYLAIPWFDACLTKRLPETPGDSMKQCANEPHWLARLPDQDSPKELNIYPSSSYEGDFRDAVWLPTEAVARAWVKYGNGEEIADSSPPPAPSELRVEGARLKWNAAADLQSGLAYFVVSRDGERVATVPEKPTNPYGRPIAQGLLYSDTPDMPLKEFSFELPADNISVPSEYTVHAVNTVGLHSEPSKPLKIDP